MIKWVHERCQDWSVEYRMREFPVGWPPLCQINTFNYLHNPEGLSPAAQEVSQAVFRMRATRAMENRSAVLIAHELFAGTAKSKARAIGIAMPTYWRHLHDAYVFLAARIEQPMKQSA